MKLYHVTSAQGREHAARDGVYRSPAFADEGFIHCAYRDQLPGVLERYFASEQKLVILEIDRAAVAESLVDENLLGGGELFPHLYAPLPWTAVLAWHAVDRGHDGNWPLGFLADG